MLTIFIRSRNEEALIGLTLERVFTQKTAHKFEVIVLDSASADDTVKIAARFPCRLISIPKNLFTYSAALNYGVSLAQGDFFIPLSAHAVPADEHWLDNLVKPLLSDQHTAATFSRQIGWPDLGTLEKAAINREFQPISFNREITALTESSDLYCTIFFSNVSSCIRISAAKKFPFLEMPYSEDRAFALQLLASGAEIRYVADSVVLHSHPPKFSDFRSVARNATRARRILSLLTEKELKRRFYTPGILKKGLAFIKIPLALLILSLKSAAAIGYRNKLFLCSSIGTTLGKYEGLSGAVKLPATADYTAISANAKIFSTTTELTVTEHRYTDNAENNRIVSDKLALIHGAVTNILGSPRALILGGSFGRGEGVFNGKTPLNDFDIVVVTEKRLPIFKRILLRELREALGRKVGVRHVDLMPLSTTELANTAVKMFLYDLKFGSVVYYGEESVLDLIPYTNESSIPLEEIQNLLINRMVTLLEAHPQGRILEQPALKARQIAKVLFALIDSELVRKGRYETRYRDKIANMGSNSALSEYLPWLQTAWRHEPGAEREVERYWEVARCLLQKELLRVTSELSCGELTRIEEHFNNWRFKRLRLLDISARRRFSVEMAIAQALSTRCSAEEADRLVGRWYGI